MSWTDKKSIEHIKKIRDIFRVKVFVETGTYKGMNVLTHKDNFEGIFSCEKVKKYYNIAVEKTNDIPDIWIYNQDSIDFIKYLREFQPEFLKGNVIFYLDAHFYDPKRKQGKDKFVVLDELKVLKGFKKAIIIIHDFDNNLGHITYDGIPLDMKLIKKDLLRVNPNFKFYTNELSSCDIMTLEEAKEKMLKCEITGPEWVDIDENLEYAWSKPEKTYRGILYCVPKKININGLREIK